jgi:hypothetical protein
VPVSPPPSHATTSLPPATTVATTVPSTSVPLQGGLSPTTSLVQQLPLEPGTPIEPSDPGWIQIIGGLRERAAAAPELAS